jgi:Rps23 Pro-64 3,4-dihydroxylase Tpa1-like proline 4-hydroxylase
MPAPAIKREGRVEGREIRVFDDLVEHPVIEQIAAALDKNAFTRSEIARPDTIEYRHWARDITTESTRKLPIYQATMDAAGTFAGPGESFSLYRSYCNYAAFGDMLFIHTDCKPDARELTALWFIAPKWDPEWGGETLFFNDDLDAEFVVSPRPGRVVIFDGAIPHVGRPPNRICFAPRYTYAMKFERHGGGQ